MTQTYIRWRLELPQDVEGILTAELWAGGCLGIEVQAAERRRDRLRFEVYFPRPLPAAARDLDLERWRSYGVERLAAGPFAERDWLAGYRQRARPIDLGRGFRVEVGDPARPPDGGDGRVVLAIPAQTAFGTGSHESTRLAVRWLEELDVGGLDVLDVGTGSGVLSFVAEHLGARRVVGFDLDSQAVCIARANARRNGLATRLFAGRLAALRRVGAFDLALVNVLPERVADELPRLVAVLRPGARVISSGNLWRRRDELRRRFAAAGLDPVGEKRENEWAAFLLAASAQAGRLHHNEAQR
jgi:ribosomal protein L11 methyltransferase